jgi:hypothetical protein
MPTGTQRARFTRIPGRAPLRAGAYSLTSLGYTEEEFLFEGVAGSYELAGDRTPDGRWSTTAGEDRSFASRFVVRKPADLQRFSGVVVVEWNNVSGGVDAGPDWTLLHRHLIRSGHAWIGVTAQKAGIDGGGLFETEFHLKKMAPERYAGLSHPGDRWAFDIFTQVGVLVRLPAAESPLGFDSTVVLAAGESQSAAFLVTYINAVDPSARLFDGFFVHGRPGAGAPLGGSAFLGRGDSGETGGDFWRTGERIRDDARVPVIVLQSETDVLLLKGGLALQPDGQNLRQWELAGASHADTYTVWAGNEDREGLAPERMAEVLRPTTDLIVGQAETPINSGPQQHHVGQAAFAHLVRWAGGGEPPPAAPRLELDPTGTDFVQDRHGNARGGVRTPWMDVPAARLTGLGQRGAAFAFLCGRTEPFDDEKLRQCYPGGRSDYIARFETALDRAIAEGFILADDGAEILSVAEAAYPVAVRVGPPS